MERPPSFATRIRNRLPGVRWALVAVVTSVAPALAILASGKTFIWRDSATLFAPVRGLVDEALRGGRLPLWNPYEGYGLPLLAQMIHGVLHPVSLMHAWLVPGTGMEGLAIEYIAVAALGAWVLAREMGCSPAASALAGMAYGLSGYVQGLTSIVQLLGAGATAPWAVAGIRAARRGTGGGLAAGAAGMAAMHFAGDPQWTIAAVALGLALAGEQGWRSLVRGLVSIVFGTGLAAIQLIPSWFYLEQSIRDAGLSPEDQVQWALAGARVLEFFSPGLFQASPGADIRAPVFLWLGGPTQWNLLIPFLSSVHVGAVVIALALLGVRASRTGLILGVGAVVSLWLALGPALGAQQALAWVPIWGSFRYAEKLVGPLTLCLSLLAAIGVDHLVDGMTRRSGKVFLAIGLGALAGWAVLLLPLVPRSGLGVPETTVLLALSALSCGLLLSGAGLVVLGGSILGIRKEASRRHVRLVAVSVVAITAILGLPPALRAGRRHDAVPTVVNSHPDPILTRLGTPLETMPPGNPLRLDAAELEIVAKGRLGIASTNAWTKVDQVAPTIGLIPRNLRLMGDAFGADVWPMMRRFGLTHIVFPETPDPLGRAVVEAAVMGGTALLYDSAWGIHAWRVPHRPYVHFADRVSTVPAPEMALEAIKAAEVGGVSDTFVVGQGSLPAGRGEVLRVQRLPEQVDVEARSGAAGLLVVADAYWPGWKASIDGEPAPIYQADFLVRAVRWPTGRHVLRMTYDPPEVRLGWAVTGASLLGVVFTIAWMRRNARRRMVTETVQESRG